MRKLRIISGIFAAALASTSCVVRPAKTAPRAFTPPPTHSWPTVADTIPNLPEAPQFPTDEASNVPPQLPGMTPDTLPEVPDAPKRTVRRPTITVVPPRPPATGPVTPETLPPPRLAQIFTPEQMRENTKALDESLDKVNREVTQLEGKNLNAEQKETVERIKTFRKQAEQVREQDLMTAVILAKRAEVLAKDLLEHLP